MDDIKTVDSSEVVYDPVYQRQKEGVAKMRASLLACTDENGVTIRGTIESITAMRIYHQMMRIIKYTELMDKIEDKLYKSIDNILDNSPDDSATMIMLLSVQEKLQKSMIESHKLLQPYLDIKEFSVVDLVPQESTTASGPQLNMKSEERDRLRSNAQQVLLQLKEGGLIAG